MKSKTLLGVVGLLAGMVIAVGVPWVVLVHGRAAELSSRALVGLSAGGIGGGVLLAAMAIYRSITTPSKPPDTSPKLVVDDEYE